MNTLSSFRSANTVLRPSFLLVHVRHKGKAVYVRPRNEQIKFDQVSIKEDGVLVQVSMRSLLRKVDLAKERIELIASEPQPIVAIVNMREEMQQLKRTKEKQREAMKKDQKKEVQFTWGSEDTDMEHKLSRLRSHLETGARLDVVFSTKKRTAPPPVKAQQDKVADTITRLSDVSTVWKPVEWRRNMAVIYLRGIATVTPPTPEIARESIPEEPSPPPRSSTPGKARDFKDLSEFGYTKPATRNPLAAKRDAKKYPKYRPPAL